MESVKSLLHDCIQISKSLRTKRRRVKTLRRLYRRKQARVEKSGRDGGDLLALRHFIESECINRETIVAALSSKRAQLMRASVIPVETVDEMKEVIAIHLLGWVGQVLVGTIDEAVRARMEDLVKGSNINILKN